MSQITCYPRRALVVFVTCIALTVLGLSATGSLEHSHLAYVLVGIAQGLLIGLALIGAVEYVVVQPAVRLTRVVQHWRRGHGD